jgi:hypothetical protein
VISYLTKKKFTRNKTVYEIGKPAKFLYIVIKGDFEQFRGKTSNIKETGLRRGERSILSYRMPEISYLP